VLRIVSGRLAEFAVVLGVFIVNVKNIGAGAVIVGALTAGGLGVGSGVASADQSLPASPGATWKLDRPHWNNWDGEGGEGADWDGDWNGWYGGPGWDGGGYYGGCAWVPPAVSMWVPPVVC
jgi:hypothetical protein